MSSLERITDELKGLGYSPFDINTPHGRAVAINYLIKTGKYLNKKVLLGFSFQEEGYPEYPPHWIHISPPYSDQLHDSGLYKCPDDKGNEREWLALSRPPKSIWDNLATKCMKHYLDVHIISFCANLK